MRRFLSGALRGVLSPSDHHAKEDPEEALIAAWIEAKNQAFAHLCDLENPSEDAQRRPSVKAVGHIQVPNQRVHAAQVLPPL